MAASARDLRVRTAVGKPENPLVRRVDDAMTTAEGHRPRERDEPRGKRREGRENIDLATSLVHVNLPRAVSVGTV